MSSGRFHTRRYRLPTYGKTVLEDRHDAGRNDKVTVDEWVQ